MIMVDGENIEFHAVRQATQEADVSETTATMA